MPIASAPDPEKPVEPVFFMICEMRSMSDDEVLELERCLKQGVKKAKDINEQRVKAVFYAISKEKSRRDL